MNRSPLLGATLAAAAAVVLTACGPQRPAANQAAGPGPSLTATESPSDTPTPTPTVSATTAPPKATNAALLAAEAKWKSSNLPSYTFTFALHCFCPPDEYVVTVKGGKVVSATPTSTDEAKRGAPALADVWTIEKMFEQLHTAYEGGGPGEFGGPAAKVQVSYDAKYGFPTSAFIDWATNAIDEESGYSVTDFVPPSPASIEG
ncbi:MAG: hypothetical protein JWM93_2528 [Frankiales bacterium]|nr:hypothetical protein [Frankiales bacterium]